MPTSSSSFSPSSEQSAACQNGIAFRLMSLLRRTHRSKGHAEKPCFAVLLILITLIILALWNTPHFLDAIHCCAAAVVGFSCSVWVIPSFMTKLLSRGVSGRDLNKLPPVASPSPKATAQKVLAASAEAQIRRRPQPEGDKTEPDTALTPPSVEAFAVAAEEKNVPESLGIVCASVFILLTIASQLVFSSDPARLLDYNAAMLSITFMAFLGFADDILDLRWRYKMVLPLFASLPLLCAYKGGTRLIIPAGLRSTFGEFVEMGILYHVYMSLLTIFCSNSINIYAGINGLEVGQSIIIAIAVVAYNSIELLRSTSITPDGLGFPIIVDANIFSLLFAMPFIGCSLGLLSFNWYPSQVFVGDTYTYFAGILLATVGISGHFSRTLLLFFMPQIANYFISLPQLLGFIPCPRHRLPRIDPKTMKLNATPNWTLINFTLKIFGPMTELRLVILLLALQVVCCILGIAIRYSSFFGVLFV